jgi:alpha-N-arabinofuranosidase
VQCDTFSTEKYKGIPYLDVSATYSRETNTAYVNVVNRHKDKAIATDITGISGEFTGKAEVSVVTTKNLEEAFTFDKQNDYIPVKTDVEIKNNKFSYSFPPHSFTQLRIELKKR